MWALCVYLLVHAFVHVLTHHLWLSTQGKEVAGQLWSTCVCRSKVILPGILWVGVVPPGRGLPTWLCTCVALCLASLLSLPLGGVWRTPPPNLALARSCNSFLILPRPPNLGPKALQPAPSFYNIQAPFLDDGSSIHHFSLSLDSLAF